MITESNLLQKSVKRIMLKAGKSCAEKCNEPDLFLTEPYLEFDSSCDSYDPFKCSLFAESFNDVLPSPTKFSRSELLLKFAPTETSCCRGAIVSLVKPHKILAVASDILSMAEFSSEQICGRSINVLFGPRTDVASLNVVIKNTGHDQSSTLNTVLSSSTGADLHVAVTFSPYRRASDGSLSGCLLQIDCIYLPDLEAPVPMFALDDVDFLCDSRPSQAEHATPDCIDWRHPHHELHPSAGLENNKPGNDRRQQGWCSPAKSLEPVLLLDDFGLLSDPPIAQDPAPASTAPRGEPERGAGERGGAPPPAAGEAAIGSIAGPSVRPSSSSSSSAQSGPGGSAPPGPVPPENVAL